MLIDLEDAAAAETAARRSRVCIVGGGIAGLVLATKLAGAGVPVHLLEAGGSGEEERSQSLFAALTPGKQHLGVREGRFRLLGGSSTRWGGQLLPYTSDVFAAPAGVPSLGWPVREEELTPYYGEVEKLLGADALPFTAELYDALGVAAKDRPPRALFGDAVGLRFSKWLPFAMRNLGKTLAPALLADPNMTVFLHANATEVLLSPDGARAEAVLVRNYRGDRFRFDADEIVVAAGTMETSRLLLASRSVCADGVGNAHGLVGRGFHDHLSLPVGVLRGDTRRRMLQWFAPMLVGGHTHTAKLECLPAERSRDGLLSAMAHITIAEPETSGAAVVRDLLRAVQQGKVVEAMKRSLPLLPRASVEIAAMAWAAKVRKRRAVSAAADVTLRVDTEQVAREENRILLHPSEVDALGQPRMVVAWGVARDEVRTLLRYASTVRAQMQAAGLQDVAWDTEVLAAMDRLEATGQVDDATCDAVAKLALDTYHPMGGAAMGNDATTSVVDAQLRVHGVPNLSLASAAVYPGGGSSNPTFTLVALTLRMADRLMAALR